MHHDLVSSAYIVTNHRMGTLYTGHTDSLARRIKRWKRAWKIRLIEEANPHGRSIANCPMWPLPDAESYPEVHARCMATTLPRVIR